VACPPPLCAIFGTSQTWTAMASSACTSSSLRCSSSTWSSKATPCPPRWTRRCYRQNTKHPSLSPSLPPSFLPSFLSSLEVLQLHWWGEGYRRCAGVFFSSKSYAFAVFLIYCEAVVWVLSLSIILLEF
jgi:hypothetical protein